MSEEKQPQEGRDANGRFNSKNLFYLLSPQTGKGPTPMYKTPEELAAKAVEYFEWADRQDKGKYTLAGIRLFLGMSSKATWSNYKNREGFTDLIEKIETVMEDYYEKKLQWAGSTQGAIFWLKNKAGWRDEVTQNQNVTNIVANFGNTVKKEGE